MPLDPSTTLPILQSSLISSAIAGIATPLLAMGLANGLFQYAAAGIKVITVDVGTLGAGKGTGVGVICPTPALQSSLISAFGSNLIAGIMSVPLATAIALGYTQCLATALINTVHAGVGLGSGVAILVPNPGISIPVYISAFVQAGMAGPSSALLATAIATGLDQALPACTGVVVISGAPSIAPGAGAGLGVIS